MKINVVILDKDQVYLDRLVSHLSGKYSSKLEIYSFTQKNLAMEKVQEAKVDIFLADNFFEINVDDLPLRTGFAYIVESAEVETYRGQTSISKFQKLDLIYRQILSIYSEKAGTVTGLRVSDDQCRVIAFATPAGGVGSSTMAAASAKYFAQKAPKVLYLNLERYGSADLYFDSEGQFSMSDVIFSLKSQKANLAMKLESTVKQDEASGVYFYSEAKLALDMHELHIEDIVHMLNTIKLTQDYDYIILDMDFDLSREHLELFRMLHALVVVSDGSSTANFKVERAYEALLAVEQNEDFPVNKRMSVVYNKFSNKTGQTMENNLPVLGGAPRYEHARAREIVNKLQTMEVFSKILKDERQEQ